jgi:putative inorganic carbon (hco3(-)) transporter
MKLLSRSFDSITECRLRLRGVIAILLITAVYLSCLILLPRMIRYLAIGAVAFSILFFLKPRPGSWLPILPFFFLAGVTTVPFGEFNPALATLMMFAFVILYTADRIIWNHPLFIPSRTLFFLFIAFMLQVASVFISIHIHGQYAWNAIRDGSSLFLFSPFAVIVPCLCRTEAQINRLLRALLLAILLTTAVGVIQYQSISGFSRVDISIGYLYRGRVASFFGNANIFAAYLELTLPLAIALFFREREWKWKLTALTAAVLGVLSVLFTFSRGGLVGVSIGCGITIFYIFRKKIWVPVAITLGFIAVLLMSADTFDRQMSFFTNPAANMTQPTILHRYISYQGFLHQFAESPITGIGWGSDEFFWGRSTLYSFWEVRHRVSTETLSMFGGLNSAFLNQAVKGGVIALAAILLLFATIYATFFKAMRRGNGLIPVALVAGIFSFMIHQILGNQIKYPTNNSEFWILTGLLIVFAGREKEPTDKDEDNQLIRENVLNEV